MNKKLPKIILEDKDLTIYILAEPKVTNARRMLDALINDALCVQNWEEDIDDLKDSIGTTIKTDEDINGCTIYEIRIRPIEKARFVKIDWKKV